MCVRISVRYVYQNELTSSSQPLVHAILILDTNYCQFVSFSILNQDLFAVVGLITFRRIIAIQHHQTL